MEFGRSIRGFRARASAARPLSGEPARLTVQKSVHGVGPCP